jgi:hypothetical protein
MALLQAKLQMFWSSKYQKAKIQSALFHTWPYDSSSQFIPIQASFLPTIFNLPLVALARLSGPIRSVPLAERKVLVPNNLEKDPYENSTQGPRQVREIWRLLEYLMAAGPLAANIWTAGLELEKLWDIVECLDTGSELPSQGVEDIAQCLIGLLSWVPGSLVGEKSAACEQVKNRDEAFAAIEELEQVNTNVSCLPYRERQV